MNRHIRHLLLVCVILSACLSTHAQSPGSANTENTSRYIGGTRSTLGETLYIGPNANITVDGTWHVYSKYVWISPAARILGTGSIVFHNPSEVGGTAGPTVIDGNNNIFIHAAIVHANNQGMEIRNVTLPTDLATLGWTNNTSVSTLRIGKDFNMSVDGADVWLDATSGVTGDFVFDADATLSNYRPNRMVITNNSIQSHMVKQNASSGFVFPVGTADGNYTPAQITGSGTYHVSVQDYAASSSNEALLSGGMNRTWHVYANASETATVAFQHYTATDTSPFNSASPHFVTQYLGGSWTNTSEETGIPATLTTNSAASPVPGSSLQDLAGVPIAGSSDAPTSYFTKTNRTALPVTLATFKVSKEGSSAHVTWTTTEETNADRFEIERSTDAKVWQIVGEQAASNGGRKTSVYMFIDPTPASGSNYYRLKMIDLDGTYAYSRIHQVTFDREALRLMIHPNPVTDQLFIKHTDGLPVPAGSIRALSVVNLQGRIVLKSSYPVSTAGVDMSQLPSGMYVVSITLTDGTLSTHKVIVKR